MKRGVLKFRRGEAKYLAAITSVIILLFFLHKWVNSPDSTGGGGSSERRDSPAADSINSVGAPAWWTLSPLWAEDQRPQTNPHKFRYILNEPEFCGSGDDGRPVDLLVLVASAVGHRERRDAIRGTWGAREWQARHRARVLFMLGQGEESQGGVVEESSWHGDIVQEDFKDTYRNLTLKTVMGLKWSAIFCPQAKFVMKTDDDIFVNLPLLRDALAAFSPDRIVGCIKNGAGGFQPAVNADMLPAMPPAHPHFTAGAGYVIPGRLVQDLYVASLHTKFFPVEDVFTTAHCARRIGAHPPTHDARFSCGQMVTDACQMEAMFTGHKVSPEAQFEVMEALHQPGGKCKTARSN